MEVLIYRDNEQKASFQGDGAENLAWIWLLKNQHQSTDWALKYGGFQVKVYHDSGEITEWTPYKASTMRRVVPVPRKKPKV